MPGAVRTSSGISLKLVSVMATHMRKMTRTTVKTARTWPPSSTPAHAQCLRQKDWPDMVKGIMSPVKYLVWRPIKLNQYFLYLRKYMNFLLASLKTIEKLVRKSHQSVQLSFVFIGQFFPVYIHSRLSEQCSGSQAGYGTTFRYTQRRLSESQNKLSEESYWKEFHNK